MSHFCCKHGMELSPGLQTSVWDSTVVVPQMCKKHMQSQAQGIARHFQGLRHDAFAINWRIQRTWLFDFKETTLSQKNETTVSRVLKYSWRLASTRINIVHRNKPGHITELCEMGLTSRSNKHEAGFRAMAKRVQYRRCCAQSLVAGTTRWKLCEGTRDNTQFLHGTRLVNQHSKLRARCPYKCTLTKVWLWSMHVSKIRVTGHQLRALVLHFISSTSYWLFKYFYRYDLRLFYDILWLWYDCVTASYSLMHELERRPTHSYVSTWFHKRLKVSKVRTALMMARLSPWTLKPMLTKRILSICVMC